ncbi:hypothetical protein [Pedobacter sp. N23S346]|uniref:hypothetical protein n=1 Tax=Pedobacter sp. N23S346 TaxID=3402750 RepID=UPI003AC1F428
MSIYFQYPSIDEFQNLIYPINAQHLEDRKDIVEDKINQQHIEDLKDYLALKPV